MKRFQPLVFSAALLFLAACGENTQPKAAAPSFSFSIDPGSETVSLTRADAAALGTLQVGDGDSDEPRILFPDEELALTAYNPVFLPGNILEITAEFTNVTDCTFEQPFTFTRADSTSNIVASQEPEVTDADLGGDGELSPDETTSTLTFTVEHMGQPFTYEVFAEAVVDCGDDGEEPPVDEPPVDEPPVDEPTPADIAVTKDAEADLITLEDGVGVANFTVNVQNLGETVATGVTLTDTLVLDLLGLTGVDATATVTPGTLPDGCSLLVTDDLSSSIECDLGDLAGGANVDLNFSFTLAILGNVAEETTVTVTNTATADTITEESDNNTAEVELSVTVPAVDEPPVDEPPVDEPPVDEPTLADIAVTKAATAPLITLEDGVGLANFTVDVANLGETAATGVTLTDVLTLDLGGLAGVDGVTATATVTPGTLPEECDLVVEVDDLSSAIVCDLGEVAGGATETLTFSFTLAVAGNTEEETDLSVLNTATADADADDDASNDTDSVSTSVTVPAPAEELPAAGA